MTVHFVNLLDQLLRRSLRMASLVEDMLGEACEAVFNPDDRLAVRVIARDRDVDVEEVEVEAEVIRLMALYQPVGSDLRLLCTVLKVNSDLERIADCAVNIAERACHLILDDSWVATDGIREMMPIVRRMLHATVTAYGAQDGTEAHKVFSDEEVIDALYGQVIQTVASKEAEPLPGMAGALDLISVAKNLERIADHAVNIAEDVIFLSTGEIVRHGNGRRMTEDDSE
jgi:phosphate transport system protein